MISHCVERVLPTWNPSWSAVPRSLDRSLRLQIDNALHDSSEPLRRNTRLQTGTVPIAWSMVLRVPDSGLALESSAKSTANLPAQAFAVTLSDKAIEDMIQCVQNGQDIQLSMGDAPVSLLPSLMPCLWLPIHFRMALVARAIVPENNNQHPLHDGLGPPIE